MIAENIDDARLKRKLTRFAKRNFSGDKNKAASFLLQKAIDLSDVIDWKRFPVSDQTPMLTVRTNVKLRASMANRPRKNGNKTREKRVEDLTKLPFYGMWADREDMKDSVAWVNAMRKARTERRKARHESR